MVYGSATVDYGGWTNNRWQCWGYSCCDKSVLQTSVKLWRLCRVSYNFFRVTVMKQWQQRQWIVVMLIMWHSVRKLMGLLLQLRLFSHRPSVSTTVNYDPPVYQVSPHLSTPSLSCYPNPNAPNLVHQKNWVTSYNLYYWLFIACMSHHRPKFLLHNLPLSV